MAIRNAATPSYNDVNNAVNGVAPGPYNTPAADGDTVNVPAGTGSWTSTLSITKGITLMGQTTTDPVNKTANDQTIILDDVVPRAANPIILINPASGVARVSGLSFRVGGQTAGQSGGFLVIKGPQTTAIRLDHCHFGLVYNANYVTVAAAVYGVIDHCVLDFPPGSGSRQSFLIRMANWGGNTDGWGDGSWADPSFWGSEKFIFIEDNCLSNTDGNTIAGNFDGDFGGRWVFRNNHVYDLVLGGHGMEGRLRSIRAVEVYNNDFHYSAPNSVGGWRGGTGLFHDNTYAGMPPVHGMALETFRTFYKYSTFLGATGDNPWDVNDTEGNGTYVAGHAPFLYDSGTAATGSNTTTIVDTTKNWTAHQWIGFTARRVSDSGLAYIQDNTNNQLTVFYRNAPPQLGVTWAAGDQYQIHKLLSPMDGNGRGQGDLVTGQITPVNSTTGTSAWPHQKLEPCYSWNNLFGGVEITPTPGNALFYQGGGPAGYNLPNRDFYNRNTSWAPGQPLTTGVGVGTLAQRPTQCTTGVDIAGGSSHPGVGYWATDTKTLYVATATDTWTAYYTPYIYPHPLVSGSPPPNNPPTVSVYSPSAGATLSGTVSVLASASGSTPIASVQFTLDSANLGALDTVTPYSVSWNTTTAANGSHSLGAVATDTSSPTPLTGTASPVSVNVDNAPVFTSGTSATFTVGSAGSFTVTVTGLAATLAKTTGALPSGVTFTDNANNTATLAGTPATGTAGTYPLLFTATNSTGPRTQNFTLTIVTVPTPVITSPLSVTAIVNQTFSYQITATNNPTSFSATSIPAGLSFNTGSGAISGTPTAQGTYNIVLGATNVAGTGTATLVLTVNPDAGSTGGGIPRVPNAPENVSVIARRI